MKIKFHDNTSLITVYASFLLILKSCVQTGITRIRLKMFYLCTMNCGILISVKTKHLKHRKFIAIKYFYKIQQFTYHKYRVSVQYLLICIESTSVLEQGFKYFHRFLKYVYNIKALLILTYIAQVINSTIIFTYLRDNNEHHNSKTKKNYAVSQNV
jgi:predicted nucleotidyltransferase